MTKISPRILYANSMPYFETREEWINQNIKSGRFLPKNLLLNHNFYLGNCRNASLGIWLSEKNIFIYKRTKFGSSFLESIKHPEDEYTNGRDVFLPHIKYIPRETKLNDYLKFVTDATSFEESINEDIKFITENLENYLK